MILMKVNLHPTVILLHPDHMELSRELISFCSVWASEEVDRISSICEKELSQKEQGLALKKASETILPREIRAMLGEDYSVIAVESTFSSDEHMCIEVRLSVSESFVPSTSIH